MLSWVKTWDDVRAHQRRQPEGRPHVVREDQERRAVRQAAAVRRQPVDDGAHRVLANAEMKVAAGTAPAGDVGAFHVVGIRGRWIEVAQAFQRGMRRRIEVGRAAEQRRQARRNRVHHLAAGDARRHALRVGRKDRHAGVPAGGQGLLQAPLQFSGLLGKGLRIRRHPRPPFGLRARTLPFRCTHVRQRVRGNQKLGLERPAEALLRLPNAFDAERRAVRLEAVLFGRAVAEVRAHEDQRGPRRLGPRGIECRIDRGHVVAVGNRDRLPSVRLEAPGAVFRERDVGARGQGHVVVVIEADQLAESQVAGRAMPPRRRPPPSGRRR